MSKKVFAFDIDGTLLTRKGKVLPETIVALKEARAQGHTLVLCSGRPYFDMLDIANKVGVFDYLICNNGAYFYDMNHEQFYINREVDKNVARAIFEMGYANETFFALHTDKGVYRCKLFTVEPIWAAEEIRIEWHRFDLIDPAIVSGLLDTEKITQVSLRATAKMMQRLLKEAEQYQNRAHILIAGDVYLDVNPYGTTKLTGLEDLARHIKMSTEDFVAFGDSGNDVTMLGGVGLGIAMGNSTPDALAAADIKIGDNDTPAIAMKIRELIK